MLWDVSLLTTIPNLTYVVILDFDLCGMEPMLSISFRSGPYKPERSRFGKIQNGIPQKKILVLIPACFGRFGPFWLELVPIRFLLFLFFLFL